MKNLTQNSACMLSTLVYSIQNDAGEFTVGDVKQ